MPFAGCRPTAAARVTTTTTPRACYKDCAPDECSVKMGIYFSPFLFNLLRIEEKQSARCAQFWACFSPPLAQHLEVVEASGDTFRTDTFRLTQDSGRRGVRAHKTLNLGNNKTLGKQERIETNVKTILCSDKTTTNKPLKKKEYTTYVRPWLIYYSFFAVLQTSIRTLCEEEGWHRSH